MTKDDQYKIGLLIVALCAITWMFLSDAWGAGTTESAWAVVQAATLIATGSAVN